MITRGFKPVGWVAAVGAAALGCYMLSLRVASERADLTSLERRIVETRQQIRALQTELGTRGRLQQLERWNDEVLALSAPGSGQFLASETQLARFTASPAPVLDGAAEVRMAAAAPVAPAAPAPVVAAPAAQHAVASPQRAVAPQPALQQPLVRRASLNVPPQAASPAPARAQPAAPRAGPAATRAEAAARPTRIASTEPRATAPARATTAPSARTRTASAEPPPARRASLLDERTLRDIGAAARAERRGGTRD
jgi:hypothetical protein